MNGLKTIAVLACLLALLVILTAVAQRAPAAGGGEVGVWCSGGGLMLAVVAMAVQKRK